MDFIFTGTPTKREILIYLRNRKHSLLNYPRLKREILNKHKETRRFDKNHMRNIFFRNKYSHRLQELHKFMKEKVFYKAMNSISSQSYFNIERSAYETFNNVIMDETKQESENIMNIESDFMASYRKLTEENQLHDDKEDIDNNIRQDIDINITDDIDKIQEVDYNIYHEVDNIKQDINNKEDINKNQVNLSNKAIDFNFDQDYTCNESETYKSENNSDSTKSKDDQDSPLFNQKPSFFDEVSDDGNQKDKIDISKIVSPTKSKDTRLFDKNVLNGSLFAFGSSSLKTQRKENLKMITEKSNQKVLDLSNIKIKDSKPVAFNFTKLSKEDTKNSINSEAVPLKELDKNTNKGKRVLENYDKVLIKNTKMNTGYKNIIIRYTDKLIKSHIKNKKNREQKVKFADLEDSLNIHNSSSPVPIIKRSKFHNKMVGRNKHKEVVFIQNVDLSSFNLEDDF